MRRLIASSILMSVALGAAVFTACSGSGPDGNSVQVGTGDAGSLPNAEIPTEFTSAADALAVGTRLFDQGETEKAIEVLLEAVKMDPDLAEAYFKLGIAYSLVEAEDTSVEKPEETPQATSKKAAEKKKNSEKAFESAVDAYKKIIAKNKEDDVAYFYMGLAYNKLNEDEDAGKALLQAVKLQPENTEYQTELGAIYIKLAKYHEAVTALKKAVELDPDNIDAQELLEKAEAGKKRIDFTPPKKDEKDGDRPARGTAPEPDTSSDNRGADTRSNSNSRPPARPAKTPPAPARTPR